MELHSNYSAEEYKIAKKNVEKRIGFYVHLSIYLIINLILAIVCINHNRYLWIFWPMFWLGIGLFFHGMKVFGMSKNSKWKQRKIQKEVERQRRSRGNFYD